MDVRRTVPVALDVASDDIALLEDTVDTFLWSAQYVVDYAFRGVRVSEVRVQKPRRLQRRKEYRVTVSPSQPNWRRRRRTLGRALEQRDVERERRLFSCPI